MSLVSLVCHHSPVDLMGVALFVAVQGSDVVYS